MLHKIKCFKLERVIFVINSMQVIIESYSSAYLL